MAEEKVNTFKSQIPEDLKVPRSMEDFHTLAYYLATDAILMCTATADFLRVLMRSEAIKTSPEFPKLELVFKALEAIQESTLQRMTKLGQDLRADK